MSTVSLAVVIPHFKNKKQLDKCLKHLDESTVKPLRTIVEDDTEGLGFTVNSNHGIRKVLADNKNVQYILLLNQDCYLEKNSLEEAIKFMSTHIKVAIAGFKQLSAKDQDQITWAGSYEAYPAGKHKGGRVSRGDCSQSQPTPWVTGACMIIRTSAIIDFGIMDENMKMVYSDSDWCFTARSRGWETWYIAEAVCVHEGGESTGPSTEKMKDIFLSDMVYFRDKWVLGEVYEDLSREVFV